MLDTNIILPAKRINLLSPSLTLPDMSDSKGVGGEGGGSVKDCADTEGIFSLHIDFCVGKDLE